MSQRKIASKITDENNKSTKKNEWILQCAHVEAIDTIWKHFLTRNKADKS